MHSTSAWLTTHFRDQRRKLFNAWLLALVTALAGMALLGISGWFISAAALAGLAANGPAVAFNLLTPSSGIRAFALGRTVSRYFERLVSHDATFDVMQQLRTRLFSEFLPRIPGPLSRFSGGHLLERLLGDVERLENAWLGQCQPTLVAAATAALLLVLTLLTTGALPAMLMLLVFALFYLMLLRLGKDAVGAWQSRSAERDHLRSSLVQALDGLPEVLAFGIRDRLITQWSSRIGRLAEIEHRLAGRQAMVQTIMQSAMQWLAVGVLLLLIVPVQQGQVSGPFALALMLLVLAAAEVTLPLAAAWQRWPDTVATVARLQAITDAPLPATAMQGDKIPTPDGVLDVSHLELGWPGQPPLLSGFSFSARAGVPLAIVGPSGSGKSTLLHALMGLHPPLAGAIRFGGVTQSEAEVQGWRDCFALLLQQQQLFTGTLRDNLRVASPDASDELLWHALEQAQLAETVHQRGGLDHWIGPRGLHLSGGQGRRLSLARVLLRNAPIVLLDEPFTGLEQATADQLSRILEDTLSDKILITVTHDPRHVARMAATLHLSHTEQARLGS